MMLGGDPWPGAAPVAGKGKLRVAHLAANAPAIDVYRRNLQREYLEIAEKMITPGSGPSTTQPTIPGSGSSAPIIARQLRAFRVPFRPA